MRICIVGKYPPIQGGVSARTYRLADELAKKGHAVHVVTNASEVEGAYRMRMGPDDERRCESRYDDGYVRVHRTTPSDKGQFHVPWHNPFVTKLAGLAVETIEAHNLECVFSYYLEPYGIAGHLATEITGLPHLVRTAGSDVGRLWQQRHFQKLYDHVFRSAQVVFGSPGLNRRLLEIGVSPERIVPAGGPFVPINEFSPRGSVLDLSFLAKEVRETAVFVGIYGKLGPRKGSSVVLRAIRHCLDVGIPVHLLAMCGGESDDIDEFKSLIAALRMNENVTILPFVPHWGVPPFLRACTLVACLEHDFPIRAHAPIVAQEVLATGTCALLSQEIAEKQPNSRQLVHGVNCVIAKNAIDPASVADLISQVITSGQARAIGDRGREYVEGVQAEVAFPDIYLEAMETAASRKPRAKATAFQKVEADGCEAILDRVQSLISGRLGCFEVVGNTQADWFSSALKESAQFPLAEKEAVRFGLQVLAASKQQANSFNGTHYRFLEGGDVWRPEQVGSLVPALLEGTSAESYACNPMEWFESEGRIAGDPSMIAILPRYPRGATKLYCIQGVAAAFLSLCRGGTSVSEIAASLQSNHSISVEEVGELAGSFLRLGLLRMTR